MTVVDKIRRKEPALLRGWSIDGLRKFWNRKKKAMMAENKMKRRQNWENRK